MGNFGNNDGDFDITIQPEGTGKAGGDGPAIEQGSGISFSSNIERFLDPDDSLPPPSFGPNVQGGGSGGYRDVNTEPNENYNPGTPPGSDQFDPADPVNTNVNPPETLNEETLEAISNAYAAEAFSLIARRGINPLRAEVLGVHEFVPIAKGEDFTPDESSITLNFGADTQTVVVNQVVRLIELHRTLIQTANLLSEQLVSNASGFTKEQIDGGLLIGQYCFSNTGFFQSVFERAYPYGNIFDSDVEVILDKFVEAFKLDPDFSNGFIPTFAILELIDSSQDLGISETAQLFGFTSFDQLNSSAISDFSGTSEFESSIIKISLIRSLIPSIVAYINEIVGIQNELNNAIDFSKFDLQTATNNSNNYSKIISLCMGESTGEIPQISSFLDFGTGVSNAAGSNNTINFLNVVSKLYSECLFMRNHTPGDYVSTVYGVNSNYDYVNDAISDQVILSSGDTKIRDAIKKLKQFKPYTNEVYKAGVMNGSSNDIGSSYYSVLNGTVELYDYSNYGSGLTKSAVESMLNTINSQDHDQALAELIAAICFDQVVGANVNASTISSNLSPGNNVSENNGAGLFPAMNVLRKILHRDPDVNTTEVDLYQNFRSLVYKEDDDNLSGIFSNLTQFASVAIGLNNDPNNEGDPLGSGTSGGRYIPLEYNNELTDEKKNASNFSGTVRLGPSVFFLDAIVNNDTNLQTLNDFIQEFKSEYHKVRNFVIDYYSLGFDLDGGHDSSFGSAGKKVSGLNPLGYFYWYMDLLADELESAINDNGAENAFLLGLFAQSGNNVESMLKTFKSAYFGTLVARRDYCENNLINPLMPDFLVNKLYQLFCYRTDRALISLLSDLFQSAGELRTDTTEFTSSGDSFTSLLTNTKSALTNDEFSDASGNQRFGFQGDVNLSNDGSQFENLGYRGGAKTNLSAAIGIYGDGDDGSTFEKISFGGYNSRLRGVRPSLDSTYFHHVLRNTPVVDNSDGITSAISESKFRDHFLSDAHNYSYERETTTFNSQTGESETQIETITENYDRPVANPGQFGGIFSTSSFQRALIFYMWAMRIYKKGVSVNFDLNTDELRYNTARLFSRGTIQALKRSSVDSLEIYQTTTDNGRALIQQGFSNTSSLMAMVKDAIRVKRNNILQPLAFFEKIIKNLEVLRDQAQDILNASVALNNDPRRYLAGSLIRRVGFLDSGNLVALNEITSATLHKSLINHFQSPVDSNISKLASVYDSFAINDVKLMYKVLSQPGYGYNSNERYGKKDIIHVGVPLGMLTALRNMSFESSGGDEAFNSSSRIAIHVVKNDELNPDVRFYPRTFVFDMERFILPKSPSGFASNHIANYSDSWSFQDILTNMQVYHSFDGGLGDGRLGGTYPGINSSNSLSYNIHSNHVFDYYLKMYCRLTTGLDFDEESFKVFSSKLFNGSVDANMQQFFNDYTNSLVQLYPSANVNPDSAIAFTRALNVSKNYVAFSPFSRIESALSVNCFDRVFSIMINERDFTIPLEDYGASVNDVFVNDPVMYPNGRLQVKPLKLSAAEINIEDGESLFDPSAELSDKLDEYLKGLDPNSTHVSKYSIHISLLKS